MDVLARGKGRLSDDAPLFVFDPTVQRMGARPPVAIQDRPG